MTSFKTNVISIPGHATANEAKALMQEKRIRHLPITNDSQEIVALVTSHDLPDHPSALEMPIIFFAKAPVISITSTTSLKTAALTMLEKKISCLLITDINNNVEGIITTDDLIYHLTTLLKDDTKPQSSENFNLMITAGEFFRRLSEIGI